MGNLHPLFVPVLVLTVASGGAFFATTLYLMPVLKRAFDPFWLPQMLYPPVGFKQQYKWGLFYAGAVVFKSVRLAVFDSHPYDFRGQISRTTFIVCLVLWLFALMAIVGLLVLASFGALWLWNWWNALPTPDPPKPRPLDEELPPL